MATNTLNLAVCPVWYHNGRYHHHHIFHIPGVHTKYETHGKVLTLGNSMCLFGLISYDISTTGMGNISERGTWEGGGVDMQELFVLSTQVLYKPKTPKR
jgi:hypothetical protein